MNLFVLIATFTIRSASFASDYYNCQIGKTRPLSNGEISFTTVGPGKVDIKRNDSPKFFLDLDIKDGRGALIQIKDGYKPCWVILKAVLAPTAETASEGFSNPRVKGAITIETAVKSDQEIMISTYDQSTNFEYRVTCSNL